MYLAPTGTPNNIAMFFFSFIFFFLVKTVHQWTPKTRRVPGRNCGCCCAACAADNTWLVGVACRLSRTPDSCTDWPLLLLLPILKWCTVWSAAVLTVAILPASGADGAFTPPAWSAWLVWADAFTFRLNWFPSTFAKFKVVGLRLICCNVCLLPVDDAWFGEVITLKWLMFWLPGFWLTFTFNRGFAVLWLAAGVAVANWFAFWLTAELIMLNGTGNEMFWPQT